MTTYRLLAYALVRAGRADEALDVMLEGARRAQISQVAYDLAHEASVSGTHLVAKYPARRYDIEPRLPLGFSTKPSLRVVLTWETDATDVDLIMRDKHGTQIHPRLDLSNGYGPEAVISTSPARIRTSCRRTTPTRARWASGWARCR